MTLPSSGALTMSAINAEFGLGNNLGAYRGVTWYTDAGASGTFTSTNLGFDQFYSKRATSPTFSFTIGSNQTNANLRDLAVAAGWNGTSAVVATISGGVVISSNSTGIPALTINGSFPGGVTLVNNGYIIGMGGNGGNGANNYGSAGGGAGGGASGGTALAVSVGVTINNGSGTIGGGGGGGGGGGSGSNSQAECDKYGCFIYTYYQAGSGGGGGRSSAAANSSGGGGGAGGGGIYGLNGNPGGAGTVSSAGAGGASVTNNIAVGGAGGNGGGWGASGSAGSAGPTPGPYGPAGGGGGGNAVTGNGNISWSATGTRLGGIS